MMGSAVTSISFVITAIYTGTFANAVYQLVTFDEAAVQLRFRDSLTLGNYLCALICMVMALRFFFGNNNYIDDLFTAKRTAGVRLYHFSVIAIQSLVLLGSSYLIRNPQVFSTWLIILFAIEVGWYIGCWAFVPEAVQERSGAVNRELLKNEFANGGLVLGALLVNWNLWGSPDSIAIALALLFAINTTVDLHVNLRSYMGVV